VHFVERGEYSADSGLYDRKGPKDGSARLRGSDELNVRIEGAFRA
jgi:hypothetical protein